MDRTITKHYNEDFVYFDIRNLCPYWSLDIASYLYIL